MHKAVFDRDEPFAKNVENRVSDEICFGAVLTKIQNALLITK